MGLCGNDQPDPAKGYVAGIEADLESLPARRIIESMAQLGQSGWVDMPGKGGKTVPTYYDFTGLGEADYARQYGDQMAEQMLALQRELGPQYVEQRLAELEAADPEGAAMRRRLWEQIQSGVEAGPGVRPANEELQRLIQQNLDRGGELDPSLETEISQSVLGQQTARGNWLGNAAATQEAGALGAASEAQNTAAQEAALRFLTGGLAPEDVAHRESQQNLANLGAFINGETPVAQFGQVSGAANGVVPFTTGNGLPGTDPNAGWSGVNNYMNVWNTNQNSGQVSPWIAGATGGVQGLNLWQAWNGGVKTAPASAGVQGGWNAGFGNQFAGMT